MDPVEQDAVLSQEDAVPLEKETVYFVTHDRWQREPGGRLDPTDEEILTSIREGGKYRVEVITQRQMFEMMQRTEPDKFAEFHEQVELKAGVRLTFDELVEFATAADERLEYFTWGVHPMTVKQAAVIRHIRVDRRMTWRSVARTCHKLSWRNIPTWQPPSNQLMGIALAKRAAELFGEDFRKDPWN